MKQTAVEWLIEKLSYTTSDGTIISHHFIINKLVEQAKEMEKEQIIDAYKKGYIDGECNATDITILQRNL
jgi:hypothetical protein